MNADTANYIPREDTLPWRVCAYFLRLPEEALSNADIGVKWTTDPKNVALQLSKAVEAGLLVKDGSVYSAGPKIWCLKDALKPDFNSQSPAVASIKPKRPVRQKPPEIDIEAIEFETVPLPNVRPVHDRWLDKVRTMQPGHHFAVEMCHAHALRAVATALRKEGKAIRVLMNQPSDGAGPKVGVYCLGDKK